MTAVSTQVDTSLIPGFSDAAAEDRPALAQAYILGEPGF